MAKGFYVNLREPCAGCRDGYMVRRWRVSRARLPQNQHERNWGECCFRTRSIVIHTPLSDEDFWATLWHEVKHVSHPYLIEGAILLDEYNQLEVSRKAGLFEDED